MGRLYSYEEEQILIEAVKNALEAEFTFKPHEARWAAEVAAEYMLEAPEEVKPDPTTEGFNANTTGVDS
jgi:hypothetical protein